MTQITDSNLDRVFHLPIYGLRTPPQDPNHQKIPDEILLPERHPATTTIHVQESYIPNFPPSPPYPENSTPSLCDTDVTDPYSFGDGWECYPGIGLIPDTNWPCPELVRGFSRGLDELVAEHQRRLNNEPNWRTQLLEFLLGDAPETSEMNLAQRVETVLDFVRGVEGLARSSYGVAKERECGEGLIFDGMAEGGEGWIVDGVAEVVVTL